MCGIVGAVATRDVPEILIEGLRRLEYRGYDSAGVAVISPDTANIERRRAVGKVQDLVDVVDADPVTGLIGIAHTRWATHGAPSVVNAHPHQSGKRICIVHNGIIENHEPLRQELQSAGYEFTSNTDSEVIAHLIDSLYVDGTDLVDAVRQSIARLDGAYAICVIAADDPERIIAARIGSPLVVGVGIGENFVASDPLALRPVTDRFIFLEEGDVAEITKSQARFWDASSNVVEREVQRITAAVDDADKGNYRHHMLKEVFEQPRVIHATLEGRIGRTRVLEEAFGVAAHDIFNKVRAVTIVACGTSFYAASVARYWIEEIARVPCTVEIASEFRYRKASVLPGSLFVTLSQSGETADTLAALRIAKDIGFDATLTICNVPTSSMVRESDLALMLQAGVEVGVASTKAFTAMLTDLMLLTILLGRRHGMSDEREEQIVSTLHQLDTMVDQTLALETEIEKLAEHFIEKHHALFLGRGPMYPVALEGALKLKEISYIHAEGYPAGELKHGPLALVDEDMPVIAVAPNDDLVEKLMSNLQVVKARGGQLYVFADEATTITAGEGVTVVRLPKVPALLAPIVYTVPLQLLSYYVAVLKGTDVDQPRNLAKSVTVE
ncbi:MAG: glutamine--fructose-6-phosphate transaminase (isomerizing) [Pseudomonadaceae bacterium]|nr:glutamine--fructose-6-phosphate transaminase (isomerizing) [Pseudomonadaceae bacterium]